MAPSGRVRFMLAVKTLVQTVGIASALIMVLFALSQAWLALNYMRSKLHPKDRVPNKEWQGPLPRILLQLPVFNEIYVIERLLAAVSKLDYPADLLTIQVLDDSTDETAGIAARMVTEIKKQGININYIHRVDRTGYKAGALQAGLAVDDSEFVAIFDADFVPQPTFLKQVVGYFTDPKIGMVQTRWEHINAEHSLLTKLLSFGIDAHFSIEQGGRQATHSFINFNGTAGMWRRKTIDEAGGWHNDCLTEDLDLSFRSQLLGWRFLFVEDITTPSELPGEMGAVRTQQFRWTKGAAQTAIKNLSHLWASRFPLSTRFIGSFHMLNSFVFPVLLILNVAAALLPLVFGEHTDVAFLPIAALLLVFTVSILFAYWTAHTRGNLKSSPLGTTSILGRAVLFMLITSGLSLHNGIAVVQGLMGRTTPFMRTPKLNIVAPGQNTTSKRAYLSVYSYPLLAMELGLAILFSGLTVYCLFMGLNVIIYYYAFIAGGYLMIVYFTVAEMLANMKTTG